MIIISEVITSTDHIRFIIYRELSLKPSYKIERKEGDSVRKLMNFFIFERYTKIRTPERWSTSFIMIKKIKLLAIFKQS